MTFDNLSTGRREAITSGEVVIADLSNKSEIEQVFRQYPISAVMHFAGSIVVPESVEKPLLYFRNNVVNTLNLLEVCLAHQVNRLIFSSTATVYGVEGSGIFNEDCTLGPINPYGKSKLMIEEILKDLSHAEKNFHYIILRYFNVAGADFSGKLGQHSKVATHLIKVALEVVLGKRKELQLFGSDYKTPDGTCIRDYIHVLDLAQAHLDALHYLQNNNQSHILNCGYGKGHSVKEVIVKIKEVTGVNFPVRQVSRRPGDPDILISNPTKIKKILKWAPQYDDLATMISTAYHYEKELLKKKPQGAE